MSSVPYIFANDYGNIPLSHLDANFANVKASVDFATQSQAANTALFANTASSANTALFANTASSANTANTANTVTSAAQPAITSVGTLTSLTVSGTVTSNVSITSTVTANSVTADQFVGDLRGSVYADDSTLIVDAVNNHVSSDTSSFTETTASNVTVNTTMTVNGLEIVSPNWIFVTSNGTTTLSNTTSYNIVFGTAAGFTQTINMPVSPVEGQITRMAVTGNAVTLALGTGNVNFNFSGLNQVGNTYAYVYRSFVNRWIKTA